MNKEINRIKENYKIELVVYKIENMIYIYWKIILMNLIWKITENFFDRKISSLLLYQDIEKIIK